MTRYMMQFGLLQSNSHSKKSLGFYREGCVPTLARSFQATESEYVLFIITAPQEMVVLQL